MGHRSATTLVITLSFLAILCQLTRSQTTESTSTSTSTSSTQHPPGNRTTGRPAPPYNDKYLDDVTPRKGFFDQFRAAFGFPTLYGPHQTAVTADVLEVGWIYAAVILAFSLLLIIPGVRRWNRRLFAAIRIIIAVSFWVFIMLCNFGQDWEVGYVEKVKTQYKAGIKEEIKATVSVNIGLRSVNISLRGEPIVQSFANQLQNETIDYNERFEWDNRGWLLGRAGLGPYAGRYNQMFRAGQRRGLPYPILWIAEYLTFDGEGLRWGRFYLQAGYFTHIMLWSAMPLWILALILFNMVPRYGGYFSLMTGGTLIVGNIIYGNLRNANQLRLPMVFDGCDVRKPSTTVDGSTITVNDSSDCFMNFHFAWCFWLCLATGICCFIIGVVVVLMDLFCPEKLIEFLNGDITQDLEEFVDENEDDALGDDDLRKAARHRRRTVVSMQRSNQSSRRGGAANPEGIDVEMQAAGSRDAQDDHEIANFQAFRKRTFLTRAQKSNKIQQRPESLFPPEYEHHGELYTNARAVNHESSARLAEGDDADEENVYENASGLSKRDSVI